MPVKSLREWLGILIRQSPAREIYRAKKAAAAAGLDVTTQELEMHILAGGRPLKAIEAFVRARELGVEADWGLIKTIDLAGRHPRRFIEKAAKSVDLTIEQVDERPLVVNCRDGLRICITATIRYRPHIRTLFRIDDERIGVVRERAALRLLLGAAEAPSAEHLQVDRSRLEWELRRWIQENIGTVEAIELHFGGA